MAVATRAMLDLLFPIPRLAATKNALPNPTVAANDPWVLQQFSCEHPAAYTMLHAKGLQDFIQFFLEPWIASAASQDHAGLLTELDVAQLSNGIRSPRVIGGNILLPDDNTNMSRLWGAGAESGALAAGNNTGVTWEGFLAEIRTVYGDPLIAPAGYSPGVAGAGLVAGYVVSPAWLRLLAAFCNSQRLLSPAGVESLDTWVFSYSNGDRLESAAPFTGEVTNQDLKPGRALWASVVDPTPKNTGVRYMLYCAANNGVPTGMCVVADNVLLADVEAHFYDIPLSVLSNVEKASLVPVMAPSATTVPWILALGALADTETFYGFHRGKVYTRRASDSTFVTYVAPTEHTAYTTRSDYSGPLLLASRTATGLVQLIRKTWGQLFRYPSQSTSGTTQQLTSANIAFQGTHPDLLSGDAMSYVSGLSGIAYPGDIDVSDLTASEITKMSPFSTFSYPVVSQDDGSYRRTFQFLPGRYRDLVAPVETEMLQPAQPLLYPLTTAVGPYWATHTPGSGGVLIPSTRVNRCAGYTPVVSPYTHVEYDARLDTGVVKEVTIGSSVIDLTGKELYIGRSPSNDGWYYPGATTEPAAISQGSTAWKIPTRFSAITDLPGATDYTLFSTGLRTFTVGSTLSLVAFDNPAGGSVVNDPSYRYSFTNGGATPSAPFLYVAPMQVLFGQMFTQPILAKAASAESFPGHIENVSIYGTRSVTWGIPQLWPRESWVGSTCRICVSWAFRFSYADGAIPFSQLTNYPIPTRKNDLQYGCRVWNCRTNAWVGWLHDLVVNGVHHQSRAGLNDLGTSRFDVVYDMGQGELPLSLLGEPLLFVAYARSLLTSSGLHFASPGGTTTMTNNYRPARIAFTRVLIPDGPQSEARYGLQGAKARVRNQRYVR